ncbi:PaaX family transcriptional regulator C-terminal domain-containing protein [Rhodovulum sp. DZ06]|uniref:PaaX family transcriptional regulator C-terminal domain-containing protein n=1 Tax=Rhodovulum sp. DZ06 TaxID=3425126 RepID=UPI003D32FFD6
MQAALAEKLLSAWPIRAGAFVVTLYGDVAAPRGGRLWMGEIVEACAPLGLSDSRVRTAVSRLVSSGRIEGEKIGRRSMYRLTRSGEAEFARATRLIYAPADPPPMKGWLLVPLPQGAGREALAAKLQRRRFGIPRPHLALAPDRGGPAPDVAPLFRAECTDDLAELAAAAWPLEELSAAMTRFLEAFAPLEDRLAARPMPGRDALALRLLLVHAWREIALADPVLPLGLLPAGWPGPEARRLFARLYLALTPSAEAEAARRFTGEDGRPLRPDPAEMDARLAPLRG